MNLEKPLSRKRICETLGLNAPVNYEVASERYVQTLESTSCSIIALGITFTQGNVRYSFYCTFNETNNTKTFYFHPFRLL